MEFPRLHFSKISPKIGIILRNVEGLLGYWEIVDCCYVPIYETIFYLHNHWLIFVCLLFQLYPNIKSAHLLCRFLPNISHFYDSPLLLFYLLSTFGPAVSQQREHSM